MIPLLTALLSLLSGYLLFLGLQRNHGIYTIAFLGGITWLGFLLPQIIGVNVNPLLVPELVRLENGIQRALFMSILCVAMTTLAYLYTRRSDGDKGPPLNYEYDYDKLLAGGVVMFIISLIGFAGLSSLAGGPINFFSTTGAYQLKWSGSTIIFNFFYRLSLPAFSVCLYAALCKRSTHASLMTIAASILPLCTVIFLGRRGHTAQAVMIVGCCLYFVRGFTPSRKWSIAIAVIGLIAVAVAPAYRTHSQIGGDWDQIKQIQPTTSITSSFKGESSTEFVAATVTLSAFRRSSEYGWGRGYINTMVKNLLPRPVVGERIQSLFMSPRPSFDSLTRSLYGWQRQTGTTITGIADAYREFWYLGCLLFGLVSWGFTRLWIMANDSTNILPKLIYMNLIHYACLTVTHNIQDLLWAAPYAIAFFWPVTWYARRPIATTE